MGQSSTDNTMIGSSSFPAHVTVDQFAASFAQADLRRRMPMPQPHA
jgi:hypothetical protein